MPYIFKQNLVPAAKEKFKCPYAMEPDGIVIHNTANDASAENEIEYMNSNTNYVSYHVAVDDKAVIQAIPFNKNAFHTGDGTDSKCGNRTKIGIEICHSKSGGLRYENAEENAVQYVAQLLYERGWGIDRVSKHQDYSGKYCPHRILDEGRWTSVLNRIEVALQKLKEKEGDDEVTFSSPSLEAETELTLSSKARRTMIVEAAIKAGAHESWREKHENREMTEGDYLGLAAKAIIDLQLKK